MLLTIINFLKNSRIKYVLALFLLLIVIIISTNKKPTTKKINQKEITVSTKLISPEEKIVYLTTYGSTIANFETSIKSNIAGKLIKKHYKKGDLVNAGTDLFSLIPIEYSSIIEKAELNLSRLENSLNKLKQEESNKFKENKIIRLKNDIKLAKKHLENVSSYTNLYTIRSNYTGIINEIFIEEGESIRNNDVLAKIMQITPTKVQIDAPEKFINDVKINDHILLKIFNKENIPAIINYTSAAIDPITRTFRIEATIEGESFPSGAAVIASIPINKILSYKITSSALTIDNSNNLGILYVDQDNKAQFLASEIIEDNHENLWVKCNYNKPLKLITKGAGFTTQNTNVVSKEEDD